MKFCFIINPKSGKERFNPLIRRLKALLERDSLAYEFQITTKPGHATALAEKATASGLFDRIVAIGGDGTINEVVNGMIRVCMQDKDRPDNYPALGIIPAGLGNDTARGLGIPRGLKDAYTVLIQGSTRYIDAGEVNGRFFINGVGVGYDGAVISEMYEIRRKGKILSGWIYFKCLLRQFRQFTPLLLRLEIDNNSLPPRRYLMVLTANGTAVGGIFNLTPKASLDDGLLDILLVEAIPKHTFLLNIPRAIMGKHLSLRQVSYYMSKRVTIKSDNPVPCHIDGESYYNNQFSIRLLPKALKIVAPYPKSLVSG
ncbi:MAG: diacylglycerol kinase family lipid kinase [Deltaproteobacteria bacterium]|jgi:YegS/Rv2252/BmrU family lipid kinase|nr:diacylglycerol kinase family lipid kinase [Deltaproteobacteria bacterium]MDL1987896.1 diacylglycerol kinase family lipid kinase [Deltaproteobacteria bacterium]